jgi:3-oxoadipate enol-lactonase
MSIVNISYPDHAVRGTRPLSNSHAWPIRLIAGLSLVVATEIANAQPATDPLFGAPALIDTQAGRLAVFEVGQGPKVVVYWPSLLTDHTMYRFQAAALGSGYRQIFIDGPGHGASGAQTPGATLDSHAAAVVQVMDRLGIAKANFVGTSWGGLVGAHMARAYPNRLHTLIACNTPFETPEDGPAFADRMTVWMAGLFGSRGFFADGAAKSFFSKTSLEQRSDKVELFKSRFPTFNPEAIAPVLHTVLLERDNAIPWLTKISVPVVVIAGQDDPVISVEKLRHAAEQIPSFKFLTVETAGHLSPLERPDVINPLIEATAK